MIYPCLRPSSKDIYVVFISSPGNSVFKIEKTIKIHLRVEPG